jgi:hypothetical protein
MERGIFSGETVRDIYQSGYSHEVLLFFFDFILETVHSLHSYEYADGKVFLSFLVK